MDEPAANDDGIQRRITAFKQDRGGGTDIYYRVETIMVGAVPRETVRHFEELRVWLGVQPPEADIEAIDPAGNVWPLHGRLLGPVSRSDRRR